MTANPFLRVIEALNTHGVRYVVVGGFAAMLHGSDRVTVDLDLILDLDPPRARAAISALRSIGLESRLPVDPLEFADPATRLSWVRDRNMRAFSMIDPAAPSFAVDLFTENPKDFEDLHRRGKSVSLHGLDVRICAIDDLVYANEDGAPAASACDWDDAGVERLLAFARLTADQRFELMMNLLELANEGRPQLGVPPIGVTKAQSDVAPTPR